MSDTLIPQSGAADDRIEISVPLRTEYFATLRTMAASLGADSGFSIDEIDDLRLAISEIVGSFVGDRDDRVQATFEVGGGRITVSISSSNVDTEVQLDELATGILNSVVDSCEVSDGVATLTKWASEAAEAGSPTAARPTDA